jgi:hypothetical protein
MSKSPVEKLNELKEEELKLKQQQQNAGEEIRDNDQDAQVADRSTFTQSPSDKSRNHKGHIGPDKEPGILNKNP